MAGRRGPPRRRHRPKPRHPTHRRTPRRHHSATLGSSQQGMTHDQHAGFHRDGPQHAGRTEPGFQPGHRATGPGHAAGGKRRGRHRRRRHGQPVRPDELDAAAQRRPQGHRLHLVVAHPDRLPAGPPARRRRARRTAEGSRDRQRTGACAGRAARCRSPEACPRPRTRPGRGPARLHARTGAGRRVAGRITFARPGRSAGHAGHGARTPARAGARARSRAGRLAAVRPPVEARALPARRRPGAADRRRRRPVPRPGHAQATRRLFRRHGHRVRFRSRR